MDHQYGLSWHQAEGPFGGLEDLQPTWTVEPDIDIITKIVMRKLDLAVDSPCAVEFLAEGSFNKVYTITCNNEPEYIIRVTLPVHPRLKTMSECATIEYVRHHTNIPAPRVLHYNAVRDDELGFEWMIQDYVLGSKLKDAWPHMGWLEKEVLVRKVIDYLAQLFRQRFRRLGNVYATRDLQSLSGPDLPDTILLGGEHSTASTGFSVSEIVSIPFCYNDHVKLDVDRGPYKHSREWLAAQLDFAMHGAENLPEEEEDEDDDRAEDEDDSNDSNETINEDTSLNLFPSAPNISQDSDPAEHDWTDTESGMSDAATTVSSTSPSDKQDADADANDEDEDSDYRTVIKHRISRLQALLPTIFPRSSHESYILHHQDLSSANILVSSTHALSGIIDWECVHTAPLHLACQVPKFLRGPARAVPPPLETAFENEWYEMAYREGVEDYEKARLRAFFVDEMRRVCPEWVRVYEESGVKADFEFAVAIVGVRGRGEVLDEWIEAVEAGEGDVFGLRAEMGQL
jgi:aminoglycoside phosphotransferase (APT) family kinase protein